MALAFLALFAALTGGAMALPGTNSVTSDDIKKNAVKGSEIAKNAVKGSEIKTGAVKSSEVKNNSLTGDDIDESSLGTVPSATAAANAVNARNAATLGGKPPSAYAGANEVIPFAVQQVGDGDKVAVRVGSFRLILRCNANDGGTAETTSLILISSEEYPAFDDNNGPEDEPVPAGQEEQLNSSSSDSPNIDAEGDQGPYAIANVAGPNGLALWIRSYALGQNLYAPDSCWASGAVETAQTR